MWDRRTFPGFLIADISVCHGFPPVFPKACTGRTGRPLLLRRRVAVDDAKPCMLEYPRDGATLFNRVIERNFRIFAFILIAAWFLGCSWRGILIPFTGDDLMNISAAWTLPMRKLVWANITPFTPIYRPFGSAYHRLLFALFGLHPLPFRLVTYVLLGLNLYLLFRLVLELTSSSDLAIITVFLDAYHARFIDMYLNNGIIYDILCFTFYYGAMLYYITVKQRLGRMIPRRAAIFIGLFVLALNSKEMAVTLPIILLIYNVAYEGLVTFRKSVDFNLTLFAALVITAFAIHAKTSSKSDFYGVDSYTPHFTLEQWFNTTQRWLSDLFLLSPESHKSRSRRNSARKCCPAGSGFQESSAHLIGRGRSYRTAACQFHCNSRVLRNVYPDCRLGDCCRSLSDWHQAAAVPKRQECVGRPHPHRWCGDDSVR